MPLPEMACPTERPAVLPLERLMPWRSPVVVTFPVMAEPAPAAIWKAPRISTSAREVTEFRSSIPPRRKLAVPVELPQTGLESPDQSTTRRSLAAEKPALPWVALARHCPGPVPRARLKVPLDS